MRSPVFVGRGAELELLAEAVGRAELGRGGWVEVVGEAGIGKSRLVAELVSAVPNGVMVATGRTSNLDRSTPYRPLTEALLTIARDVVALEGDLAPYAAALGNLVPRWRGDERRAVDSPAVLGESILRLLDHLAGNSAILLVLEDLHWADESTLEVCDYLAEHAAAARALVVATRRAEEFGRGRLVPGAVRIELGPLGTDDVSRIANICLDSPPTAGWVDDLVSRSGGLPLLVEDLLDGGDVGRTRYADLVIARLDRLDEIDSGAHRVVVAAAMIGEHIDWATLTATHVASEEGVAVALRHAEVVGLVVTDGTRMRFRHALTQEVILSLATPTVDLLTKQVADALESRGDLAGLTRAADLWERLGDSERARGLHENAAAVAQSVGFPSAALGAIRRAAALAVGDERVRLEVELLGRLCSLGRIDEARRLGSALTDRVAADPTRRTAVALALARVELAAGRPEVAARHLAGAGGGPEAQLLRARLALLVGEGDRRTLAQHLAHQVVASSLETRPELACEALELAALCARTRSLADARAELERALAVAAGHRLTAWRLRLLNELGTVEMLADATGDRLERARDAAREVGALDVAAATLANIAALLAMRGELDESHRVALKAVAEATRLGLAPVAAAAHLIDGVSHGFAGDEVAMERSLRAATKLAPDDADLRSFAWGAGRGLCALVREDRQRAVGAFQNAIRDDAPVGSLDTGRALLALVQAVISGPAADPSGLEAARAVATPGAGWSDLWLGSAEAVTAGAAGRPDRALIAFAGAERAGQKHPLFRAVALRLVAEAALRDGWGDPVAWLRDAEATFIAGRQDRIASACRTLLARAGVPTPRRRGKDRALAPDLLAAGVTDRETEVLGLLTERLSNKEIAARLYLSPRTVEKHVASLLRKLEVEDRAGIADRARAHDS